MTQSKIIVYGQKLALCLRISGHDRASTMCIFYAQRRRKIFYHGGAPIKFSLSKYILILLSHMYHTCL